MPAKVGEPPTPTPPGVEFVGSQKKYLALPPATPSLHTLTKGRGGRFLLFLLYGYSNCRAPYPHPLAPQKEPLAERLGTRC